MALILLQLFGILSCSWIISQTEAQTCSCVGGFVDPVPSADDRRENVACGKSADISSRYSDTSGLSGPACVAVNGRTNTVYRTVNESNTNCVHTNVSDKSAWWSVDLGQNYTITNITIYRREENEKKEIAQRMAGIEVLVDQQLCYRFPNTSEITVLQNQSEQLNVTCGQPLAGKTVKLRKDPADRLLTDGFQIINICEVQVWVCHPGLYGAACNETCSDHCRNNNTCDNYFGSCPNGCLTGYYGNKCDLICGACINNSCEQDTGHCSYGCEEPGYELPLCNVTCRNKMYGENCTEQCGHCGPSEAACNVSDGHCTNCEDHFDEPFCKKCAAGFYGVNCGENCSGHCKNNDHCDIHNGSCINGCSPGYHGSKCNRKCGACKNNTCEQDTGHCSYGCKEPGYELPLCNVTCRNKTYGENCTEQCGHCGPAEATCNVSDGRCDSCEGHFDKPLCKGCSSGYHGYNCDLQCGFCKDSTCEQETGHCLQGCVLSGYEPPFCNDTCQNKTYGLNCTEQCGHCNSQTACNVSTGHCNTCEGNFALPFCTECSDGYFGDGCSFTCGHCKNDASCDKFTGYCQSGCLDGYHLNNCSEEYTAEADHNNWTIGVAVGAVVVIVAVILIVCLIFRRRRTQNERGSEIKLAGSPPIDNFSGAIQDTSLTRDSVNGQNPSKPKAKVKPTIVNTRKASGDGAAKETGHIYNNTESIATSVQSSPPSSPSSVDLDAEEYGDEGTEVLYRNDDEVYASFRASEPKLDKVQRHLVDMLASGKLHEEFSEMKKYRDDISKTVAALPENRKKNRFASVVPYDKYRVVLSDGYTENGATDFVNASYISRLNSSRQYIAAQGPKDNTVVDFWRTIWQENIIHIVILTNVIERRSKKCEQYWPEEEFGKESYGPFIVNTTHVECRDSFYIRTLSVRRAGRNHSRRITQYHYTCWPDHGVPATTSLVMFWRYVSNKTRLPNGNDPIPPVLVHCSAGVGRTGTYIGLDLGMGMAVTEGRVDVRGLVQRIRDERCLMVQAVDQYVFLHKALLEAYTAHNTNVTVSKFESIYSQPIQSGQSHSRVDKEFQSLSQMLVLTPMLRCDTAKQKENLPKNRYPEILAGDEHLVYLTEQVSGRNQYINAIFMPTFRDPRGNILTQLPLPSTMVDFWRLVYGNDVTTVVSLSSPSENQQIKSYCQYWPLEEGETIKTGPYMVVLQNKTEHQEAEFSSYTLMLGKKDVPVPRAVQLYHYMGWSGEVGGNPASFLRFIDTLVTSHMSANTRRMVVQCSDGVGKSGLFSTLCDVISRMTYDREVDVYMTVRHAQSVAHKAVSSVDQYRYCYQVVQSRVREMSVYANT